MMEMIRVIINYLDDDTSITRDAIQALILGAVVGVAAWILVG